LPEFHPRFVADFVIDRAKTPLPGRHLDTRHAGRSDQEVRQLAA